MRELENLRKAFAENDIPWPWPEKRDPRSDPQPGDVLTEDGEKITVIARYFNGHDRVTYTNGSTEVTMNVDLWAKMRT